MRNQIVKSLALVLIGVYTGGARAAEHIHADHEAGQHLHIGTEPIGVMGAHAHAQGDWMFSYRAMRMEMDGNRDGSSRMSTADVFSDSILFTSLLQYSAIIQPDCVAA